MLFCVFFNGFSTRNKRYSLLHTRTNHFRLYRFFLVCILKFIYKVINIQRLHQLTKSALYTISAGCPVASRTLLHNLPLGSIRLRFDTARGIGT